MFSNSVFMHGDIPEEGMWYLHQLFSTTADYMGIDLEDTEYAENGVHSQAIHAKKSDHKKAIYLLSEVFSDEFDDFQPLASWDSEYSGMELNSEHGDILYLSNNRRDEVRFVSESEDVSYNIYFGADEQKRWNVLDDLAEGQHIKESLRKHYDNPAERSNQAPYHQLHRNVLIDGLLPEKYRSDLQQLIE